jgi:hypothetical protein
VTHTVSSADALRENVDILAVALDTWAQRHDREPRVRESANVAVECIDAAMRELYQLRSELVGQVRAFDDETARRADALLARIRAERGL